MSNRQIIRDAIAQLTSLASALDATESRSPEHCVDLHRLLGLAWDVNAKSNILTYRINQLIKEES